MRIALLEDETHLAELVTHWIESEGYQCDNFQNGRELIEALKKETYDLLILDWMVPEVDGEAVLAWVRENINWDIPVVFMTQRDTEEDIVKILSLGADDYITKPLRQKEMMARVTAIARRAHLIDDDKRSAEIKYGPYTINTANNSVLVNGEPVKLTQKEYELVVFLFRNLGRIVSRNHMLQTVWGHSEGINTRTADTHISRIRNKLGLVPEKGWRINAIYHHGYRLEKLDGNTDQDSAAVH